MHPFQPGKRIKDFQKNLIQAKIDVALLHYSRDVYYYTGFAEPSLLLVSPEESILFTRGERPKEGPKIWIEDRFLEQGADLKKVYGRVRQMKLKKATVGLCLDVLTAGRFLEIQEAFRGFRVADASPLILQQRMVKDEEEVSLVKKACAILARGALRVGQFLRPGVREIDLAAEVEAQHRRSLHSGAIFLRRFDFHMGPGPVISGPNLRVTSGLLHSLSGPGLSTALPTGASERKILEGEHVVIDLPSNYGGYHGDQSRTYVPGRASSIAKEMYGLLRNLSDGLIEYVRPGIQAGDCYAKAWSLAKKLKIEDSFLAYGEKRANFVGHGVGLEINEPPILKEGETTVLKEGFILAIELPLTHPEAGVMKLEDTVVVKPSGAELLTTAPRELIEVT